MRSVNSVDEYVVVDGGGVAEWEVVPMDVLPLTYLNVVFGIAVDAVT